MKKLITILFVAFALIVSGVNADAQKKAHKGKGHPKGKTTAMVKVARNADGTANPTGHTYSMTDNDVTAIIELLPEGVAIVSFELPSKSASQNTTWTQEGNTIHLEGIQDLTIDKRGQTLTDTQNGKCLKIVK